MEHITTADAAEFVAGAPANVAATITPQHMLLNRNALFVVSRGCRAVDATVLWTASKGQACLLSSKLRGLFLEGRCWASGRFLLTK